METMAVYAGLFLDSAASGYDFSGSIRTCPVWTYAYGELRIVDTRPYCNGRKYPRICSQLVHRQKHCTARTVQMVSDKTELNGKGGALVSEVW